MAQPAACPARQPSLLLCPTADCGQPAKCASPLWCAALWKDASGAEISDFTGWTAATLTDGVTVAIIATDAIQSVDVLATTGGFSEFASADGGATAVACTGSDVIAGLSLDKDGSGNVM